MKCPLYITKFCMLCVSLSISAMQCIVSRTLKLFIFSMHFSNSHLDVQVIVYPKEKSFFLKFGVYCIHFKNAFMWALKIVLSYYVLALLVPRFNCIMCHSFSWSFDSLVAVSSVILVHALKWFNVITPMLEPLLNLPFD